MSDTFSGRGLNIVFYAINEINLQLPKEQQLSKDIDELLFDRSGNLDSLGLVNLIVAIEQKIDEEFGITVSLANEEALATENSPFLSVKSLSAHIENILREKLNV